MTDLFEIPNLIDQFSAALIKDQVQISEFVESDKYLGKRLWPRQKTLLKVVFLEDLTPYDRKVLTEWGSDIGEVTLCPKLEARIDYLKANNYPHFRTIQLVGGRRSGKGYMTAAMIAYKVYLLTQLENVGKAYGIEEGKDIYFSIVADSLEQAKAHQFGDAQNMILDCKPLAAQRLISRAIAESVSIKTPYDVRKEAALRSRGTKVDKDMASLIVKAFGTNARTIRGSASIMFVFDEMAHLIGGESRMSDEELYKASIPSLIQFKRDSMIVANSSPWTKQGKFFELYQQALQLQDVDGETVGNPVYPDHFMIQFPSWEMYKDWKEFGFNGAIVVDPAEDPILAREEQQDPDSFKVEYRSQFAEVIDAFLNPAMVDRMYDPKYTEEMLGRRIVPTQGAIGYMRYKGHGDPASVGANFGLAIGHVEQIANPESGIEEDHVIFDFIDAFYPDDFKDPKYPERPGTIDWLEVVPVITELINRFRPFEFTFDQFDSTMAIQQLTHNLSSLGLQETLVYSKPGTAPLNDRRWKNFRAALNLGRVHAPHPDTFSSVAKNNSIELSKNELKFLQEKNGRVDKQTIGPIRTKDIADCIAEVTDTLIGDTIGVTSTNATAGFEFGAQHGYTGISAGNTQQFPELAEYYSTFRKENHRHTPRMPHRGRQY